jgi:hypothetical protein
MKMGYSRSQQCIAKDVSPKEAELFLAVNNFPGQRKLNQAKASMYATKMAEGTMRPVDIDVLTMPDGIKYLMNGQHVCTAIVLHGKSFPARVQYWRCENDTDAWHLFGTFDVHATRTERQIIKAARPFLGDELADVPLRVLQQTASALAITRKRVPDFWQMNMNKTEKADLLKDNASEVLFVNEVYKIGGSSNEPMFRVPVIAAMVATFRASPEKALRFWTRVVTGEMITRSDSEYKLRSVLSNRSLSGSISGGHMMNRSYYCYCVAHWNSWVRGEKRSTVKIRAMRTIPDVLA